MTNILFRLNFRPNSIVNLDGKLIGVIYAGTNVAEVAKSTGIIETAMGFGMVPKKS